MNKNNQTLLEVIDGEVLLWIGYIRWWEAKHSKPATYRMLDALTKAKEKLALARLLARTPNQPLM